VSRIFCRLSSRLIQDVARKVSPRRLIFRQDAVAAENVKSGMQNNPHPKKLLEMT